MKDMSIKNNGIVFNKGHRFRFVLYYKYRRRDRNINIFNIAEVYDMEVKEAVDYIENSGGYICPLSGNIYFREQNKAEIFINSIKKSIREE